MYTLLYTQEYIKLANRFVKRHPDKKSRYDKTLRLLTSNPHHPSLRLHALGSTHQGLSSVSINLSYRITLELQITDKEIILINVGDHH
jgi:mRNA-degrading endonuclease YafQ of YafQ-DinJ toxin-antitoxin module